MSLLHQLKLLLLLVAIAILTGTAASRKKRRGRRRRSGTSSTAPTSETSWISGRPSREAADARAGLHSRRRLPWAATRACSPQLLKECLDSGISVVGHHLSLLHPGHRPGPFHDSARAIQFIRSKAKDWNIDPKRIAATGGSAGAGISLWLGFHDDMADPKSDDPVLRQSTRLTCMVGVRWANVLRSPVHPEAVPRQGRLQAPAPWPNSSTWT